MSAKMACLFSLIFADASALTLGNWMMCLKMAKGGKLEPWNWHVLAH